MDDAGAPSDQSVGARSAGVKLGEAMLVDGGVVQYSPCCLEAGVALDDFFCGFIHLVLPFAAYATIGVAMHFVSPNAMKPYY